MSDYTHEYSNFPDSPIVQKNYMDISDDIADVVGQIETAKASGDYATAAQLIADHPELSNYNFSSADVNRFIEEIRNTQIFAQSFKRSIQFGGSAFLGEEIGDLWITTTIKEDSILAATDTLRSRKKIKTGAKSDPQKLVFAQEKDVQITIPKEYSKSMNNIDNYVSLEQMKYETEHLYQYKINLNLTDIDLSEPLTEGDIIFNITFFGELDNGSVLLLEEKNIVYDQHNSELQIAVVHSSSNLKKIYPFYSVRNYSDAKGDITFKIMHGDFTVEVTE